MVWTVYKGVVFTVVMALTFTTAHAGNVVRFIEQKPGKPPKYEETKYNAKLVEYNYDAIVVAAGIAEPIGGHIKEVWIDEKKLTLKENTFKSGHVDTEELGAVWVLFSSSVYEEGFILLLKPDQLEKLKKIQGSE